MKQGPDTSTKALRSRFQKHIRSLIWKAWVQRKRRWHLLALQCVVATMLYACATLIARPVFLTPLQTVPKKPLTSHQILKSFSNDTILGYKPNVAPYVGIMENAAKLLDTTLIAAATQQELDQSLYDSSKGTRIQNKVIWVLWTEKIGNVHKFKIRSTEMGRLAYQGGSGGSTDDVGSAQNPHLQSGFLSVQLAVSQALLEHTVGSEKPKFQLSLVAMPVSPLMDQAEVRRVISLILMCFTCALLLPVIETEALIVTETRSRLKRALRLRRVAYSSIYIGWLAYAAITAFPVIFLGAITMILIFRWIHLMVALLTLLTYTSVMSLMSMIMAMYHSKAWIACVWTTLFTFLQTFLAELMVHHDYHQMPKILTFFVHMFLPPLGLEHALNQFALLETGSKADDTSTVKIPVTGVTATLISWWILFVLYFLLLMLLQRTIGHDKAIGGQQSWKSIIFKQSDAKSKPRPINAPTGKERQNLQPVDEFVAKAISFRNIHIKDIMGMPILSNVTFDIYRCEYTMLFAERIQTQMMTCLEDLLTGLTYTDTGSVNVLGEELKEGGLGPLNFPYKMGYCDRSSFLIEDLSVNEHLELFMDLCLWHTSEEYIIQYSALRFKRLLRECDLEDVQFVRVSQLDIYYRAQLCWALTVMLEPMVVVLPNFVDGPTYKAVITDKIIQYKQFVTIVKISYSSIQMENADRIFMFDNRVLCFGGTPAYMFFKYGREYRLRLTLKSGGAVDDENVTKLLQDAEAAGATIRSHLGSLLILRVPTNPTENVVALVKALEDKDNMYGITSMNISLPDSEEILRRCLHESRPKEQSTIKESAIKALKRIAEPKEWRNKITMFSNITQLRIIGRKYFLYYVNNKMYLVITMLSAVVAGACTGLSMGFLLDHMIRDTTTRQHMEGSVLTVEALMVETALVLQLDDTEQALKMAHGYVLSEANATHRQIRNMYYIALPKNEKLTEYLVTKAIDSPDYYVYMYAYGIDISVSDGGDLDIKVLYSPMHHDRGAAARSLARAYTALLRYYTKKLNASIEVTDYPLVLELTPWMKKASTPPLLIQFLLMLTISHITLIPSNEYGLVRYFQSHALNFSPMRYWFSLFFCDLVHYWLLVALMSAGTLGFILITVPPAYYYLPDLLSVPFMLFIYGMACIPQAYLFSLGPRPALNSMAFIIVNIVFGEATIVAKLFYGGEIDSSMDFMVISPQYNIAYALVKIKTTFLYNSECGIFRILEGLCATKMLHKCCQNCGVLQPCFEKQSYLYNIRTEIIGCCGCCILFVSLLLLLEYHVFRRMGYVIRNSWRTNILNSHVQLDEEQKEQLDVVDKERQILTRRSFNLQKRDTFGEYLLAVDVSSRKQQVYVVRNIFLGVGKGEALALSGLKRHGRQRLCELLAGYRVPSEGRIWTMSEHNLNTDPIEYGRNVAICCDLNPLPLWMTVYDALELIAILRGVPWKHVVKELQDVIEALQLDEYSQTKICMLPSHIRKRLHFAAAVVGAPPVLVVDQCTAYQPYGVRRAMYHIIYHLRKSGHAIFISANNVEDHMPVTNRLAILLDGRIAVIDHVDRILDRYSDRGHTVVIHLKDDVDIRLMFSRHFQTFLINDMTDVLVNMQVLDELSWTDIFTKMEQLKAQNTATVYSYIVCAIPIDYIYNTILTAESRLTPTTEHECTWLRGLLKQKPRACPTEERVMALKKFQKKYDITTLKELPWSVIFQM